MRQTKHNDRIVLDAKILKLAESERRARQKIFGVMLAMENGGPGRDALVRAAEKYKIAYDKVNGGIKKGKESGRRHIIEELHARGLV